MKMMSNVIENYNYVFYELADKRVRNWWLFGGPWGCVALAALYLYTVCIKLPKYMENRKPYDLKRILDVYNIFQIVANALIFYRLLTSGWTTHYSLGCQPVDYSDDPLAMKALRMCWWTCLLKIAEFMETAFFVLRKKQSQITKLHLYHHTSTFIFSWVAVKFIGGGMTTFYIILNSAVHLLMYSYYFLSARGPKMQKKLALIKSKLTMIQIIQFWIMLGHSTSAIRDDCDVPSVMFLLFIPNVVFMMFLFANFYKKNYHKS